MSLLNKFFDLAVKMDDINIAWRSREGESHYYNTPVDAFIFMSTGIDGDSCCIVPREGDETLENSPVYFLSPCMNSSAVVWIAKNFHDFLRLIILCKTVYRARDIYSMSAIEFNNDLMEQEKEMAEFPVWQDTNMDEIMASILEILPITSEKYDYDYFISCYQNEENHLELSFLSDVSMRSYKLGCYGETEWLDQT